MKVALTIAGSDSGAGAGIQADLKTFEAHQVYATTVLTAVTAQNTTSVKQVWDVPASVVSAQMEAILEDFEVGVVKTGMLVNAGIIHVVADFLEHSAVSFVLDPVMVSTSGRLLLELDALSALKQRLLPLSSIVTPNVAEAEQLASMKITTLDEMLEAAKKISLDAPRSFILVKGAHLVKELKNLSQQKSWDVLYKNGEYELLEAPFIYNKSTHGTGCTLASAIAANLLKGMAMAESVRRAKQYVTRAIELAPVVGHGHQPLCHNFSAYLEH